MNLFKFSRLRSLTAIGAITLCVTTGLLALNIDTALAAPPNAVPLNGTTNEDTEITIDTGIAIGANEAVSIGPATPAHGTAVGTTVAGKHAVKYMPGLNQTSGVSFQYQICTTSPTFQCGNPATVTITITPVNDGPQTQPDTATVSEDSSNNLIDALLNDNAGPNEPGDTISLLVVADPANGTATISANKISYTPDPNFCGVDGPFNYTIKDSGNLQAVGQVTVTVTCVNDPPDAINDSASVSERVPSPAAANFWFSNSDLSINVKGNDSAGPSGENPALAITNVGTPSHGVAMTSTLDVNIHYIPDLYYCGADTFTYTVKDDSGQTDTATVTVNMTPCSTDKPTLSLSTPYDLDDHKFTIDIILNSPDIDVAAIDFILNYDSCLIDPDVPTNNMLADDADFFAPLAEFNAVDDKAVGQLRYVAAYTSLPIQSLAGPTGVAGTSRHLASARFMIDPSCGNSDTTLFFTGAKFTGLTGLNIPGSGNNTTTPATVTLTDINAAPTDIALSNNVVAENSPSNTTVGTLSTVDADANDTFVYTLVGPGPNDNTKFKITGDQLILKTGQPAGTLKVRIQSDDGHGAVTAKEFTITVANVNQAPVAEDDGASSPIVVKGATDINVMGITTPPAINANVVADYDPDHTDPDTNLSIQSATNGAHGMVLNQGTHVMYVATDPSWINKDDTFMYTITDNDPSGALTDDAQVTVRVQRDQAPGNCNRQNGVEAGDLTATGLEIFDGDGSDWYLTPNNIGGGTFNGSAYGCNANQDAIVDAGDIICTGILIFNNPCNPVVLAAGTVAAASLTVDSSIAAQPGATVTIPVRLSTGGNAVAAAAFAVDFDGAALAFNSADVDGNGLPDSVQLHVPDGLITSAQYNAAESRIEIIITSLPPFTLLTDGDLATVTLTVNADASSGTTAVTLTNSSLGNDEGQSVPLEIHDGSVAVNGKVRS
ncbi:MAG: Ig-like domain-containing protein [Caldilineaceae bacterium]